MTAFPVEEIAAYQARLNAHPIYGAVKTKADLQVFMQHHVFSVWDFMSVIKTLQNDLAPIRSPWTPVGDPLVRRFINELVLEEESDEGAPGGVTPEFCSHFELYLAAMAEVGADTGPVKRFVETAGEQGIEAAFALNIAPPGSQAFCQTTFGFLSEGTMHKIAAVFALGREHVIPGMFRALLKDIGVTEDQAPAFHFYLNRHIHLDEDFHAPLSLRLLNAYIGDSPERQAEAVRAAQAAIEARVAFWDAVRAALPSQQGN